MVSSVYQVSCVYCGQLCLSGLVVSIVVSCVYCGQLCQSGSVVSIGLVVSIRSAVSIVPASDNAFGLIVWLLHSLLNTVT